MRSAIRGRLAATVASLALLTAACGPVITLELPSVDAVATTPPVQSVIYDADGEELAVLRREYREPVSLSTLPRHVVEAVLVAEDRRFFEHAGVDLRAIVRAAAANVAAGEQQQGGSTITQQLVKSLYMPDADRTPDTKLREALLARDLERNEGKAGILEEYLNTVYFGEGAYGIEAAAHTYFRSTASDLELHQAALLAAIIRAPESLAPTREPELARLRRDDVLRRMADEGRIDEAARDRAIAQPVQVEARPPHPETHEPHFVDFVLRTLLEDPRLGATEAERAQRIYGGGLRIHTTLRPELQRAAREILMGRLGDDGHPEAAVAMVEPATGHVVAAVGNRSHEQLQFDLPTQARRQPGSTFKGFVLAAAIAEGHHPEDRVDGRQGTISTPEGGWEVRNYDRRDYPGITLSGATRISVNAAFARLGSELGISRVASLSRAMGVQSHVPTDDAQITIGGGALAVTPLDLAAAYGTIGNLGGYVPTTPVERIEDRDGETVWLPDTTGRAALAPSVAHVTAEVLQGVVDRGTGRNARVDGWQVAGKTGTTSDHTDAWFVGTTPVLSTAVWIGRAEGRVPLTDVNGVARVTGGTIPAQVFSEVMTAALAGQQPVDLELPDSEWDIVEIDPRTGLRAAPWCPGEPQRLPRVLVPSETCPQPPPAPEPEPAPLPPPPPPATEEDETETDEDGELDEEADEPDGAEGGDSDDDPEGDEPENDEGGDG